jgi:hypothetical protein
MLGGTVLFLTFRLQPPQGVQVTVQELPLSFLQYLHELSLLLQVSQQKDASPTMQVNA